MQWQLQRNEWAILDLLLKDALTDRFKRGLDTAPVESLLVKLEQARITDQDTAPRRYGKRKPPSYETVMRNREERQAITVELNAAETVDESAPF